MRQYARIGRLGRNFRSSKPPKLRDMKDVRTVSKRSNKSRDTSKLRLRNGSSSPRYSQGGPVSLLSRHWGGFTKLDTRFKTLSLLAVAIATLRLCGRASINSGFVRLPPEAHLLTSDQISTSVSLPGTENAPLNSSAQTVLESKVPTDKQHRGDAVDDLKPVLVTGNLTVGTLATGNRTAGPESFSRNTHIFYNIFIPDDLATGGKGTDRAYRIISEQLLQIAQSYVGGYFNSESRSTNATTPHRVTIHYTTIGPTNLLTESRMNQPTEFCGAYSNFQCHHMAHFTNGSESYTLEQLRQHCVAHSADRVVYLHSKGSYHANYKNEAWRKALTFGATAKECVDPPDDRCTVCGILFYTQFTNFIPGNMFSAKCDYVSKLLSPLDEFPKKQKEAAGEALLLRVRRQLTSNLLPDQVDFFGLDRYSPEHWIGMFLAAVQACGMTLF
jgi:hypothetical protein